MSLKDKRRLILIVIVAAASGLAFSTLIPFFSELAGKAELGNPLISGYLVSANAFLVFALLFVSVIYVDTRREKQKAATLIEERTSQLLRHLHDIFSKRTGLSAYLLRNQYDRSALKACIRESSEYLKILVDETRVMFEDYTNETCAVSIKLLVPGKSGRPEVSTYMRDSNSQLVRGNLYGRDGRYPYEDHSPFVDIISHVGGRDYYLCNDLSKAANEGSYKNGNKHWRKLYNATLIVAIREPGIVSHESILGFLCIDSINAKFDETVLLSVARIIASTVFYVIYSLSVFENRIISEKQAV